MKKLIALLIAATLLLSSLTACATTAQKEATITEFFETFYTVNYETALENMSRLDAELGWKVVVQQKGEDFSQYFTKDGFMIFLVSAGWTSLQMRAIAQKGVFAPTNIEIERLEDGSYHFDLLLEVRGKDNTVVDEIPQEGYLILSRSGKIEKFYIKNEQLLGDIHHPRENKLRQQPPLCLSKGAYKFFQ